MNFLNKIFGNKKKEATNTDAPSKYMPKIKIPVDELFTINFKKNGGKFLYCETVQEAFDILEHILKENHWDKSPLISLESGVQKLLQQQGYKTTDKVNKDGILFTPCEHL
ncbi:MAG: lactate utilization protein B/C, partial [Flavobacteriaceae bacterium]